MTQISIERVEAENRELAALLGEEYTAITDDEYNEKLKMTYYNKNAKISLGMTISDGSNLSASKAQDETKSISNSINQKLEEYYNNRGVGRRGGTRNSMEPPPYSSSDVSSDDDIDDEGEDYPYYEDDSATGSGSGSGHTSGDHSAGNSITGGFPSGVGVFGGGGGGGKNDDDDGPIVESNTFYQNLLEKSSPLNKGRIPGGGGGGSSSSNSSSSSSNSAPPPPPPPPAAPGPLIGGRRRRLRPGQLTFDNQREHRRGRNPGRGDEFHPHTDAESPEAAGGTPDDESYEELE